MARIAVDVPALADLGRQFDYSIPERLAATVTVGTLVRVPLHGRRVRGWVTEVDVQPPPGMRLQAVTAVTGRGPAPEVVDLAAWAAWRWAGRQTALLRSASPSGAVRQLPPPADHGPPVSVPGPWSGLALEALAGSRSVVRMPPAADPIGVVQEIALRSPTLVVTPSVDGSRSMARGLEHLGIPVALLPEGWARAAAGRRTVVGARGGVWGPAPGVGAIVVVDAHDDGLVEERAPAWSAWLVAAERARRLDIPCVLLTACPTLEQLDWGRLLTPSRSVERQGWAALDVVDRRQSDPRDGLLGERLVPMLRRATASERVVVVLNRKGRVRLLACRSCGAVAVCEHCQSSMEDGSDPSVRGLQCRRCHRPRPFICQSCGSIALKAVRVGVTKLREDLEALARLPVGEVTAEVLDLPAAPVLVGTEAVLHRLQSAVRDGQPGAAAVVFLDFDSQLLAPRFRAAEEAVGLLARASRLVGGRAHDGRVVVQTRLPDHPVLQAALRADPGWIVGAEQELRTDLRLPPVAALAELSGDAHRTAALAGLLAGWPAIEVTGPTDDRWLVRAPDHAVLCDALAAAGRPAGSRGARLRVDVDPLRA